MKNVVVGSLRMVCAACLLLVSATGWSQGMFSGLFGGKKDDQSQQQNVTVGTDPQQGVRPQATPTAEQIKTGAAKLEKQIVQEKIPSNLFKQYVGTWRGWFYTYSPSGKTEVRQSVQLQADLQSDGSLMVKAMYFDKLAQQFVLGESYHYKKTDASTVRVTITRATNERSTQTGYFNDGSLFLVGDIKDGVESNRERIDGNRWLMDGFSYYDPRKSGAPRDAHHHIARLTRER